MTLKTGKTLRDVLLSRRMLKEENSKSEDVTTKTVVDSLNSIRGGRSFSDEDVKNELSRYLDGLTSEERLALHAYLSGIAQIVSGQVDASSADDPKDHGVTTSKDDSEQKTIKPLVVQNKETPEQKTPVPQKKESSQAAVRVPISSKSDRTENVEDTSAPLPIVPKKR